MNSSEHLSFNAVSRATQSTFIAAVTNESVPIDFERDMVKPQAIALNLQYSLSIYLTEHVHDSCIDL